VIVFFGPWSFTSSPPYSNVKVIQESQTNASAVGFGDQFGYRLAVANPNKDAFDDLIIGAPQSVCPGGTPYEKCGQAYVYWGAPWPDTFFNFAEVQHPDAQTEESRYFGWDVAGGNVIDRDGETGQPDVLIGAKGKDYPGAQSAGQVVVYPDYLNNNFNPATAISISRRGGNVASVDFGFSLAVGDYDGDSTLDVAIGAIGDGGVYPVLGEVQVFPGGSQFPNRSDNFSLFAPEPQPPRDGFGYDTTWMDYNGNGRDDLLIGAPAYDINGNAYVGEGRVFLRIFTPIPGWTYIDDPTPEHGQGTTGVDGGWGLAVTAGRLDINNKIDLAIGNLHATYDIGGPNEKANAGEVRVVIYQ
jgi:hypothetical protein